MEDVHGVSTTLFSGMGKWNAAAAVGSAVCAAPFIAPVVSVLDTISEIAHGINTDAVRTGKSGLVAMGTEIYASPDTAHACLWWI